MLNNMIRSEYSRQKDIVQMQEEMMAGLQAKSVGCIRAPNTQKHGKD